MSPLRFLCLFLAAGWFLCSSAIADDAARAVVEKAIEAHGGAEKLAKLRIMRIKTEGKMMVADLPDTSVMIENCWQMPDKYKSSMQYEILGRKQEIIQIVDGDQAWIQMNGRVFDTDKAALTEVKEQKYAEGLDRLDFLDKKGIELSLLEKIDVEGKPAIGVLVKSKDHRDVKLYFDFAGGLLVKREWSMGGKRVNGTVFGDYRKKDGMPRFQTLTIYRFGKKFMELKVKEVEFLKKLDPKEFAKPVF